MKKIELINVSDKNNNKFYCMEELNSSEWKATWGRVGASENTMNYSISQWDKKYNEKLKKGYKDITSLRVEVATSSFKDIQDSAIKKLLDILQKYAKTHIQETYTVSAEQVTILQVEEAQRIIDELSSKVCKLTAEEINKQLLELYKVIPRRMKHTSHHLINANDDIKEQRKQAKKFIDIEQQNIDVMKQQVSMQTKTGEEPKTIEEALGIKIEHITDEEEATIKKLMGNNVNQYKKAFKVTNHTTQKKYDERKTKSYKQWTKLLWHGSRNENWLNIVKTGLLIRPSNAIHTGSMFGDGIYFANKAQKSIGYTSLSGSYWASGNSKQAFLALYEVNSGIEYRTKKHESWMYNLSEKVLKSKGEYDSFFCEGGADLKNDELVIYNSSQCTIKYIIEIKG